MHPTGKGGDPHLSVMFSFCDVREGGETRTCTLLLVYYDLSNTLLLP